MMTADTSTNTLSHWLDAVTNHLEVRRSESRARPRPKRNRAREQARRQARQLFAQYYSDLAVAQATH